MAQTRDSNTCVISRYVYFLAQYESMLLRLTVDVKCAVGVNGDLSLCIGSAVDWQTVQGAATYVSWGRFLTKQLRKSIDGCMVRQCLPLGTERAFGAVNG